MIVHSLHPVTLVGGGEIDNKDISIALNLAPVLVAADGGADAVRAAGGKPVAVIGDMDSISRDTRAAFAEVIHEISAQDTTDLDKCLSRISAPAILALGFLGGRLDHSFGALNSVARHSGPLVLVGGQDVMCCLPADLALALPRGCRVSLLPMGAARVWSEGLRWPLSGEEMSPTGFLSVSNQADGPVRLKSEGPVFLVLPRSQLEPLWAALTGL